MTRLKSLPFTDLYLCLDGPSRFMKGVGRGNATTPISEDYFDECNYLVSQVYALSEARNRSSSDQSFNYQHEGVSYRVSRITSVGGIWFVLRRSLVENLELTSLGIPPAYLPMMSSLGAGGAGLTLVVGETGHGKTTTASSMLRHWVQTNGGVAVTCESPPELPIAGPIGAGMIFQVEVNDNQFGKNISDLKRWNPDYIYLGEVLEAQGANELINAAMSGHATISTIHGGSVSQGLISLLRIAGKENQVASASNLSRVLRSVIHQRMTTIGGKRVIEIKALYVDEQNRSVIASAIENQKWEVIEQHVTDTGRRLSEMQQKLAMQRSAAANQAAQPGQPVQPHQGMARR